MGPLDGPTVLQGNAKNWTGSYFCSVSNAIHLWFRRLVSNMKTGDMAMFDGHLVRDAYRKTCPLLKQKFYFGYTGAAAICCMDG